MWKLESGKEKISKTGSHKNRLGLRCGASYFERNEFKGVVRMSEQKKRIGFTVACVNEFARQHSLGAQEAFRYLFQFKGISFIKENYEAEHTLDFGTIIEDLEMLCRRNGGTL